MASEHTTSGAWQPVVLEAINACFTQELAMDFAVARVKMIDSQLRPNGITDERLLAAMATVPRELYLPPAHRYLAYADEDVVITPPDANRSPRFLLEPMTFARLVQLLAPGSGDLILDVGCATGYSSAVLSLLCQRVLALESDPALAGQAATNLAELRIGNVKVVQASLSAGHPPDAPYDAICVNGRMPGACQSLLSQLKEHGKLAAVVGDDHIGRVALFTRNGGFSVRYAFDAAVPALPGFAPDETAFAF